MEQIEDKEQDDEISLIDLISVVIRYRKLIIIGTIIVTFVSAFFIFGLPLITKKNGNILATYSVGINDLPISIKKSIFGNSEKSNDSNNLNNSNDKIQNMSFYNLSSMQSFKDGHTKYPAFGGANLKGYEYNNFIQNIFKEKKYEVKQNPIGNELTITCSVPTENKSILDKLVYNLVSDTNTKISDSVMPQVDFLQKNTNQQLEQLSKLTGNATDLSTYKSLQEVAFDISAYKESFISFISVTGEPFIVVESRGWAKQLIICFFAAFFIFIFIAFMLNAIKNVKKDPRASKIISDAWKDGK